MWIFGYGSLMWGNWEVPFECEWRTMALLHGYRRAFNKASVKNWGTRQCPCPTLNLVADPLASCVGMAFRFPDRRRIDVESYLAKREGRNFELVQLTVMLDEAPVIAATPLYTGQVLETRVRSEMTAAIRCAAGTSGACSDYISQIHAELCRLGIDDSAVTELWQGLGP